MCEQAKENYVVQAVNATSSAEASACTNNSDCTTLSVSECGDYCSAWIVNVTSKPAVTAQLQAWTAANCSSCSFDVPPCVPNDISPVCVSGQCMQYYPL
jgi:hypothetical protein